MNQTKTLGQFLVGVFSEADGTPSYSRISSAACTLVAIVLLVVKVIHTGQPPTGLEVTEYLGGANAAYLANKLNGLLQPARGNSAQKTELPGKLQSQGDK